MCRVYEITYYSCSHLHHYEPANSCQSGFQFGNPGRCLSAFMGPTIVGAMSLKNRHYCPACLQTQIRERHANEELDLVREANSHGVRYNTITPDIQKIRTRMKDEVDKMTAEQAEVNHDWNNSQSTTWTEGIREVIWDPKPQQAVVINQSGRMSTWAVTKTRDLSYGMNLFLDE